MNIYRQRMENVIRALVEMPPWSVFTMKDFGARSHTMRRGVGTGALWSGGCGTPWYCLGHYAVRHDLQSFITLAPEGFLEYVSPAEDGIGVCLEDASILDYFGITRDEMWGLFGVHGCGNAQTPDQAIAYLKDFITKKWPAPEMAKLKAELEAV